MVRSKTPPIIYLLASLMFFYGFSLGGLQYVIGQITELFQLGVVGLGALVSAQHIASAAAPGVMGAVADRVGKKPILLIFAVVFAAGCLTAGASQGVTVYTVGICLIGAGCSVCESLSTAVAGDADPKNAARYSNLIQCFLSAGAIGAPLVMRLLIGQGICNWRGLFYICGGAFLALFAVLLFYPFPKAEQAERTQKSSYGDILRSPLFLCMFAGMVVYVGLENGFGYFVETLFDRRLDSAQVGAYGISAYWAGMTIARLIYSMWTYRQGSALRLSFAGAAVAFILLILVPDPWMCVAICAVVGFAYGPIWSTLVACAAQRFPDRKGTVAGLMSTGCGIGGIIYPMLTGVMAEKFQVSGAFIMLAASALLGSVLCLSVKKNT